MIKLMLVLIITCLLYMGLNWQEISRGLDENLEAVEKAKENAIEIKEKAEDALDDVKEKVNELKGD